MAGWHYHEAARPNNSGGPRQGPIPLRLPRLARPQSARAPLAREENAGRVRAGACGPGAFARDTAPAGDYTRRSRGAIGFDGESDVLRVRVAGVMPPR